MFRVSGVKSVTQTCQYPPYENIVFTRTMSRELCNCSDLMTHPCTTPAPKQKWHMVQTLVLDGNPKTQSSHMGQTLSWMGIQSPKSTEQALPVHRSSGSSRDAGPAEVAKLLALQPGQGVELPTGSACAARGKF